MFETLMTHILYDYILVPSTTTTKMADTLKFGPEWLRQLSSGGSMTSPPPSPSFGGKYKLADNRYGREEMLALFHPNAKVCQP